jgi:hypothetical protein
MPNPKKAVLDVQNCRLFSGLNRAYQWMLLHGELEAMRRSNKLATIPEEDNYGWYRMRRFFPERFIQEDEEGFAQVMARCGQPRPIDLESN